MNMYQSLRLTGKRKDVDTLEQPGRAQYSHLYFLMCLLTLEFPYVSLSFYLLDL